MTRPMALACALAMLLGCSGRKQENVSSGAARQASKTRQEQCKKVASRNNQCLDVLVALAQRKAEEMMRLTATRLASSGQGVLLPEINQALSSQRASLRQTLKEAFGKPFMTWCQRASGLDSQKKMLDATMACLSQPDCQSYAQCLGKIMDQVQQDYLGTIPKAAGRPDARPEARPDTRPDARPEARPEARPDARPEARPGTPAPARPNGPKPPAVNPREPPRPTSPAR